MVQIGLFVVNTREEVYETYRDYHGSENGFERGRITNPNGASKKYTVLLYSLYKMYFSNASTTMNKNMHRIQ